MKKLFLLLSTLLFTCGAAWADVVTTVSTAGTPLTLDQLKALSGTGGHVAFANIGSGQWTNKWLANPSADSDYDLSTSLLYTISDGSESGKFYLQRVSDSQYRTNSGWGDLSGAENIEFRSYTASATTVSCDNPISIHNNGGTQWNINYGGFGGALNAWAAYAAYGPFYVLTVNAIDDATNELIPPSISYIVADGETIQLAGTTGMELKEGEPTSLTANGADAVYNIRYVASTFDYNVSITGTIPEGTVVKIKDQTVENEGFVSFDKEVTESDVLVTFPEGYPYMAYTVTIGVSIWIDCYDSRWPVNFNKLLVSTHASRYTDKIGLNDQSITFDAAVGGYIYRDLTNEKIFVLPVGAAVTPVLGYRGWAMYGYLYIDYNNDYDFTDEGELVSKLPENTWESGSTADKTIPDFTLTSTPGDYRIRFKVDWDNTDPGGSSKISEFGGCIIDATLKVVASPFARFAAQGVDAYLQGDGSLTTGSDTGNASIWYYDGTNLYNYKAGYSVAASFSKAATEGSFNLTAGGDALANSFAIEAVDALPVSISDAGYATLYSPVALTIPAGITAYIASDEGEYLHLTVIEGDKIPANTGVILAGEEGSYSFAITTTDATVTDNALTGTVSAIARPENSYVLATGSAGVAFYKDGASTIPGFKAYLPASTGGEVKAFAFGETTAIKTIEALMNPDTLVYVMSGRRVQNPVKGLYIVSGKKMVIK